MSRVDELIAEYAPDGVRYVEVSKLFNLRNGYTPSKSNPLFWVDGTIPWFRMEDIRANGRVLDRALQHIPAVAVKGGRLFPADSLLVATSATIGEHALVTVPHLSNQRFTSLSVKERYADQVDIKFLYYYGFVLDEWCRNNTTTSSFASVDMAGFKRFRFPVPPLEVQREIVRILDTFSKLESELESELESRRRQYEHYRNSLLSPRQDVEWSTLGSIATRVSSGGTPQAGNKRYYGGSIPWLRTQDVDFTDIYDTSKTITEEGFSNSSAKWIAKDSVVVAMYGATVGKSAIAKIPLTTNQACCNIEVDPRTASYRYVFYWLANSYLEIKKLAVGSQTNINAGIVKSFQIPIPPLDEQLRIVSVLDKFDALVNDLSIGLPAELEARRKQYEYYRDKLLTFTERAA